ncbi:uncharacterized protein K489DRAFT_406899 [Dissoconium aciculare CBS 342.82]|uniref:Uncharacterized protein n=1 Tax=Dissoconium aciculare CBS 342.82 TaxID=1314786 RepID=A0A6J3MGT4_9PEZI|nr:uncharacterized protein K489DRAFT_406899 [Dissoconium aciculare CBS 342.82]KAF1826112.1 hypothetical protein K489DRAFT_406899 [Dissoconium aciculare CBS 342.82]
MLFLAVTSVFVAAAAALPSTPFAYPEGVTVTEYPNGLPEELKPSSEGSALEKRGNAGVYACNERNFGGFCVHLVVQEYTCVNLGPDSNDKISSVGPDSPKYCLFYSYVVKNEDRAKGVLAQFNALTLSQ